MFSNPLIQRYRYSTLRPRQFWIYVTIYISIILLIVSINYSGYKYQTFFEDITELYKSLYYQFLTFQVIILFIWGSYNSNSAIKEEILNKSYDFFRLLPLPAHKKALGILIGKNLVVLLFGVINLVLLVYFGLAGGINVNLQGQILLVLISITVFANSTALLSSINPAKKSKSSGIVFIVLAIFFLVPMMMNAIEALSSTAELERYQVYFLKIKIPILLLISLIAIYFSCWVFKGILRRFTHEQEPLFTRKGALLFLLGYIFIAVGLYYNYIPKERSELIYTYWLLTLIPVLLIPLGSLRNLDKYIEYSRFLQSQPKSKKTIVMYSNLALAIALFAIWTVSSIGAIFFAENAAMKLGSNLYNIFVLLTCYLFLALLLEMYVVYNPASNKIGLLLGFIAALYVILPLILSGIFESEIIYIYSPAGFITALFREPNLDINIKTSFWLMNALFCVFPALLIRKRYNYILAQRQKM
jgi:hypothetical protein